MERRGMKNLRFFAGACPERHEILPLLRRVRMTGSEGPVDSSVALLPQNDRRTKAFYFRNKSKALMTK